MPNVSLGATPPIFVQRDEAPAAVQPGKDYFYVKIKSAQVAYRGSIWTRTKRLIVASTVSASRPGLIIESLKSIQTSRVVRSDTAVNLGISTTLIKLVPAVMTDFTISIDFILDQQDRLAALATLINEDTFQSALSLAPVAGEVARTVSGLAQKMIQTFVPADEQRPVLQFTADFDLATSGVVEGYYVILASQDPDNPLPQPIPEMQVAEGNLLLEGKPVTQYSFVVLEVRRAPARTRDLNDGAPWEDKLREAEDEARLPGEDVKASWDKCRGLIREAQILLRADHNYFPRECDDIVVSVLDNCRTRLGLEEHQRSPRRGTTSRPPVIKVSKTDLTSLSLPRDLDVRAAVKSYAGQVTAARLQLSEMDSAQL